MTVLASAAHIQKEMTEQAGTDLECHLLHWPSPQS